MRFSFFTVGVFFLIPYDTPSWAMPPLSGPFGGGSLQGFRQQAQFGESIRDWFVDVKDRIFGNSHPPELSTFMNQAKEVYDHQKKIAEGFWIDLTQLSFDADRDWGFHLGPWFIIRKSNGYSNTNNGKLPSPESEITDKPGTGWIVSDFGKDKSLTEPTPTIVDNFGKDKSLTEPTPTIVDNFGKDKSLTESTPTIVDDFEKDKSLTEPTPTVETISDRETTTDAIEENSVFENDLNENKNMSEIDNETYNHFTSDRLMKMILPEK